MGSRMLRVMSRLYLIVLLIVIPSSGRMSAQEQKVSPAAAPAAASDYVGSEVCVACHEAEGKHFQATVMGKAFAHPKNDNEKLGCEGCALHRRFHQLGRREEQRMPHLSQGWQPHVLARQPT